MTHALLIGGLLLLAAASGARRPGDPPPAPPQDPPAPPPPREASPVDERRLAREPKEPPEPEDPNVVELKAKVAALVSARFRGDRRAAFDHYAPFGRLDRAALTRVLEDASVGNMFTRGAWAQGIMERLDVDRDGVLTWDEFTRGIAARSA